MICKDTSNTKPGAMSALYIDGLHQHSMALDPRHPPLSQRLPLGPGLGLCSLSAPLCTYKGGTQQTPSPTCSAFHIPPPS